ncbi:MAG: HPr family phosphocarrier protein [Anaerolineales bacterium]|jgi:phosphotransferase system HPr (HPr) family protein
MPEIVLTVIHKAGLHARPAALFVQTANKFHSLIKVIHGDRQANAKSILGVLTLGATQGAVVTVQAEGEDAEQALSDLRQLVESNFGESS